LTALIPAEHILPDPNGNVQPGAGVAPFLWVRELSEAQENATGNLLVSFVVEAHDVPDNGRYVIRQAIERVEWITDFVEWERPSSSIRIPLHSHWRGMLGPLSDEGWNTQKYLGTVTVRSN
jgi:hypothetical protein